jgi:ABC-type branched-subunit amino acid transport system substrate-binding protein
METTNAPAAASNGAWTAAAIVIGICLLSTFTVSRTGSRAASANGDRSSSSVDSGTGGGDVSVDPGNGTDTGSSDTGGTGNTAGGRSGGSNGSTRNATASKNGLTSSSGGGTSAAANATPAKSAGGLASGAAAKSGPVVIAGKTYDCSKNQNAGPSEEGVSATSINFAATVVLTGIAKSFLADAQYGMEAVRQRFNRAGGYCGRQISVKYDDDSWDSAKGQQTIEADIGSKKYFGLAVNPSSEGLRGAIDSKVIDNAGFPVVGADGMLWGQYNDPWVWPVATSTHSVMHIMAKDAANRHAVTYGIVWDGKYKFGEEGHQAFLGEAARLGLKGPGDAGGPPKGADQQLNADSTDFTTQVNSFNSACGSNYEKCDFVALLLEPATAAQWKRNNGLGKGNVHPKVGIGAPQPLFVDDFARNNCGAQCANMRVWTSFKPPIPPFDSEPKVAEYRDAVRGLSRTADVNNPHVEGAYVGMELLVNAIQLLGPAPTRAALKQLLDSSTFDSGLGAPGGLKFTSGDHFAAVSAQPFDAIYNVNTFVNWRYAGGGFLADDAVQQDKP